VMKVMALLEENGVSVFLKQKLVEHVRKIETAPVRFRDSSYQRLKGRFLF